MKTKNKKTTPPKKQQKSPSKYRHYLESETISFFQYFHTYWEICLETMLFFIVLSLPCLINVMNYCKIIALEGKNNHL